MKEKLIQAITAAAESESGKPMSKAMMSAYDAVLSELELSGAAGVAKVVRKLLGIPVSKPEKPAHAAEGEGDDPLRVAP